MAGQTIDVGSDGLTMPRSMLHYPWRWEHRIQTESMAANTISVDHLTKPRHSLVIVCGSIIETEWRNAFGIVSRMTSKWLSRAFTCRLGASFH